MTEQFSSMERDAFHDPYLLDKTLKDDFHGQTVKTVAAKLIGVSRPTLYSSMSTRGLNPSS